MAASHPRPDPSSPASIAEAGFSTTRRGYSQHEVGAFLTSVAAELGRLQERERQLEAQLRDARQAPVTPVDLDEETAAALLGEETVRVLQTARESASLIKVRAEETAARVLREANDEANRVRQDAEVEAARKRQDSSADAEAEVAVAKQQGREMVTEARAYRERVLADLDRRTKLARQQIEELVQGRDRLLQVFERARLVAVDVTSGLSAIDGPEQLVDLSPTTGPVPIMVPADRVDRAPRRDEVADTDVSDAGAPDVGESDADDSDVGAPEVVAETVDEGADVDEIETVGEPEPEPEAEAEVADTGSADRDGNVVALFRDRPAGDDAGDVVDDEADTKPDVDGIFERLRSEAAVDTTDDATIADDADETEEAADVDDAAEETPDDEREPTAFSRRDEALVPLIVGAARKLKRVLADEQNGVLDTLRQNEPVTSIGVILSEPDEHFAAHSDAITDELIGAAAAGASEFGVNDTKTLRRKLTKAGATDDAVALVHSDLVGPLRDRLERAIADGSGDNDDITKRVRAVYREWKTQHIDDVLDDVFRFAHGGGMAVVAEPGTEMLWTIDPDEPACPDCEDNSLAGPVAAGEPYPTGHTWAPAHAGCRCLTLPAGQ